MLWAVYCVFCEFKSVREKSWEKAELRKAEKTMSIIIENKDDIARLAAQILFETQKEKEDKKETGTTYILNKYDTDKDGTANELEDVIMRWAPPCENNTDVYITTVEKRSGISRHTVLNRTNREQRSAILAAMSYVENGVPANMDDVRKGWELI